MQFNFGVASCRVETVSGSARVILAGEIDLATAPEIARVIEEVDASTVEVDLSRVTYFDAHGVELLARLRAAYGPQFSLVGLSHHVRRVLDVTGFDLTG